MYTFRLAFIVNICLFLRTDLYFFFTLIDKQVLQFILCLSSAWVLIAEGVIVVGGGGLLLRGRGGGGGGGHCCGVKLE